jgi:hypothetical protein
LYPLNARTEGAEVLPRSVLSFLLDGNRLDAVDVVFLGCSDA